MSNRGYSRVPKEYMLEVRVTETTIPEGYNKNDLTVDDSYISKVKTTQYIKNKGYYVSTKVKESNVSHKTYLGWWQQKGSSLQRDTYLKRNNPNSPTIWNTHNPIVIDLWETILK